MEEINILSKLDHPSIVNYFETYDDKKYIYLVMEYVQGKEMFEKISQRKRFTEKMTAKYMQELFKAINHCHAQGVIHRDIKPENIMITDNDEIRLIDFGLSKIQTGKSMEVIAGTPLYMAPELIQGSYGGKVDLWSLGVLLYVLVSGSHPFYARTTKEVFAKIKKGKWSFDDKTFGKVSSECKNLISQLLEPNPKKRLTGQQALDHAWFKVCLEKSDEELEVD